jgi:zinc/manganese transport system permease protein
MFAGFMWDAWFIGTVVALCAGVVGFFVVMRGDVFPAHAIPNGAFAGAAGASLLGVNPLLGLGAFSMIAAWSIGLLSRRGRRDAMTALVLVFLLALGAAFLSVTTQYESSIFGLLFGEVLGITSSQVVPVVAVSLGSLVVIASTARRLVLQGVAPDIARARGMRAMPTELLFLSVVAATTTVAVPVVGALLFFPLLIGPPAAARNLTARVGVALSWSVGLALTSLWSALALSYVSGWPVGFFVSMASALCYGASRWWRKK